MISWQVSLDIHVTNRQTQTRTTYTVEFDLRLFALATIIALVAMKSACA